ncbi:MAG: hypothetical protein R3324_04260 [Halobacteriales archaeon]|nr:hypothetical protein [Halobacteriales archaeon]
MAVDKIMQTQSTPLTAVRTSLGPAIGILLLAAATIALAALAGVYVIGPP